MPSYRSTPDLDLAYALAEAGAFGPNPQFTKRSLAALIGCSEGNLVMMEQAIFRKLRRNPEIWKLWRECLEQGAGSRRSAPEGRVKQVLEHEFSIAVR